MYKYKKIKEILNYTTCVQLPLKKYKEEPETARSPILPDGSGSCGERDRVSEILTDPETSIPELLTGRLADVTVEPILPTVVDFVSPLFTTGTKSLIDKFVVNDNSDILLGLLILRH